MRRVGRCKFAIAMAALSSYSVEADDTSLPNWDRTLYRYKVSLLASDAATNLISAELRDTVGW